MSNPRAFIAFDYDHDEFLRTALLGQSKHPDTDFEVADWSVKEPFTGDWKGKVRDRIRRVDQVIVICGEHTETATGVAAELQIAREERKPYFLLWVYRGKTCYKPTTALPADKIYDWGWENLKNLIRGAR
ncbi:MAG: TIR domain-containing protein [Terriglobales bacterium]